MKKNEPEKIPDTMTMAKELLNFAEDTFNYYEDFSLTKRYLPCNKVWHFLKTRGGRIIILCSKVTEVENREYEISLYASVNGKIFPIVGIYDEINDYYFPTRIKSYYDLKKYEKSVKRMWKQIKNEKEDKGAKDAELLT